MTEPSDPPKPLTQQELKKEARKLSGAALATLADIMAGQGQDSVRLAAAREVLDRAHGRPEPARAKAKRTVAKEKAEEGFTVVVQRFTDPPDPETEDFP